MSELRITGLRGGIAARETDHATGGANSTDRDILRGIDLTIAAGEVAVIMGPNGSGKSTLAHVLAGRPGYEATAGTATLNGADLLTMAPHERARAGLFLVMQHATEVPGLSLTAALELAANQPHNAALDGDDVADRLAEEAAAVGLSAELLTRSLNVDASGGERKRAETCQLAVLRPRFAVLDELDSGLDIDALAACASRVEAMTTRGLGVLAITHFPRVLEHLTPDVIHVMVNGQLVASGGSQLAAELEATGYAKYQPAAADGTEVSVSIGSL